MTATLSLAAPQFRVMLLLVTAVALRLPGVPGAWVSATALVVTDAVAERADQFPAASRACTP